MQQYLRSTRALSELELFKLSVAEEEPAKEDRTRTLQRLKYGVTLSPVRFGDLFARQLEERAETS